MLPGWQNLPTPAFTSTRFGDPAYMQSSRNGSIELRRARRTVPSRRFLQSEESTAAAKSGDAAGRNILPFGLAAALIEVT